MGLPIHLLYLGSFLLALGLGFLLTPFFRYLACHFQILDYPHSQVKTHKQPVPYLGGLAIWLAFALTLSIVRLFTHFPTGTLHALRGVLLGGTMVMLVGLVDDIKFYGLHFRDKFGMQVVAALLLVFFDIKIKFIHPESIAFLLSLLWIVGVTNAINLIDVMDGLAGGVVFIASLSFLFISLPTEEIYVNFAAVALAGATLGFLPYNLSSRFRIFMGDTGSLSLGFVLAALSLGTSYTRFHLLGVLVPLLILAVPLYDTLLVIYFRLRRRVSIFIGSRDHFSLRLKAMGFSRNTILFLTYTANILLSFCAYLITQTPLGTALFLYFGIAFLALILVLFLSRVNPENNV